MMFIAAPTGNVMQGWKISIYEAVNEPQNKLIATVYGFSESFTQKRAEAVLKALQELEK